MGYGQKVSGQKVLCIPGQKVLGIGQKVFHIYFYICICIINMCTNMNFILVIFTSQPLRAVGVLFSPMVSQMGGRASGKSLSGLYLRNRKV